MDEHHAAAEQAATNEAAEGEPKRGPRPPPRDLGLWDYFTHHDIGGRAQSYDVRGSSTIDPDAGLVHSGAVGLRARTEHELQDRAIAHAQWQRSRPREWEVCNEADGDSQRSDRTSRAARLRQSAERVTLLSAADRDVLRRIYGPQDTEPYLRSRSEAEVEKNELRDVREWNRRRKKLGALCMLLPLTEAARTGAAGSTRPLTVWIADVLTDPENDRLRARVIAEATALLEETWGRWVEIRGPRERVPNGWCYQRPAEGEEVAGG